MGCFLKPGINCSDCSDCTCTGNRKEIRISYTLLKSIENQMLAQYNKAKADVAEFIARIRAAGCLSHLDGHKDGK